MFANGAAKGSWKLALAIVVHRLFTATLLSSLQFFCGDVKCGKW